MTTPIYFDADIDLDLLRSRKIAVIGYGAQGSAHAQNLRDSGMQIAIGQRPGPGFDRAVADGFQPVSVSLASQQSDLICLMLPDELHGPVFDDQIAPQLVAGDVLLCCHGFSLLYETVRLPADVASLLVAPKGAGHMVRSSFQAGGGVPCLVATGPGANSDQHLPLALAYAAAIGGGRAGIIETSIREETETDLFGEQAVLCGGVSHLAIAAFETLVQAGYRPEIAYFECVHELKLVIDLLYRGGLAFMRDHISNTAEFGDYVSGPRVIDGHVRDQMKRVLEEIQNGKFARDWLAESGSGGAGFQRLRQMYRDKSIQQTGERLREMFQFDGPATSS